MKDGLNSDYDWCVTFWYDGPHRAWAVVPEDELHGDEPVRTIELRTDLLWLDDNGDAHVRLSRGDLQYAMDMMDGKPVTDELEDVTRVFSERVPQWPNS